MKFYLAYGSNLNVEQMQARCPGAVPVGTAMLEGYQLYFKGSKSGNYLTIEPKPGARTPVAVWDVTDDHEKALDRYEGWPRFYYKKNITVRVKAFDGHMHNRSAFIYIMHESHPLGQPSEFYMATCLEGYEHFGFNSHYLYKARELSRPASNCLPGHWVNEASAFYVTCSECEAEVPRNLAREYRYCPYCGSRVK